MKITLHNATWGQVFVWLLKDLMRISVILLIFLTLNHYSLFRYVLFGLFGLILLSLGNVFRVSLKKTRRYYAMKAYRESKIGKNG